ncbi:hypothetical protein AgCh_004114 [Apium graveolens]
MAASNNTLPSFSPSSITTLISIKLTASNYLLWRSQFVPLLRSQKLMGYIDGTIPRPASLISNGGSDATAGSIPNLAFDKWLTTDQLLLSWISKLTNDMDCHCDFSSSGFLVEDRKTEKILGK